MTITRPATDHTRAQFDRWPTAGIGTARPDRWKMPRTEAVPTLAKGQTQIMTAENCRKRLSMQPAACVWQANAHAPTIRARLKNP